MSFEPNDNMNTIHLGNYQEFFILYMDNELSNEQVRMVDEFLLANPDVKAEFEILMSTKLPLEQFELDKKDLLADGMKLACVDEALLLYIDEELAADHKKAVEFELASDNNYRLQHQLLLQARLDPSEWIAYPNKEELYRRTERTRAFRPWMRVAAALVVIAIGAMFYLTTTSHNNTTTNPQTTAGVNDASPKKKLEPHEQTNSEQRSPVIKKVEMAVTYSKKETLPVEQTIKKEKKETPVPQIAFNDPQQPEDLTPKRQRIKNIKFDGLEIVPGMDPKDFINTANVTSLNPGRNNITSTPEEGAPIANRKGSVKGFLRKATRMIEKRTGFDPANENGELLIGAVAISLK